ncbi:gamma-glutamyl phosphate reductase [Streptococcus pyogenes]|nr:Gamma-glutamyl phosphate reductase [Streptococcus pyogenes]VGV28663.1 gamma-glutamyl phosphate reductase [Streptococcus pyogenes]VGV96395.1 gamma-glutamyl phosphate reductase [Streptococcus pyogenes]VGV99196.1 gamma-glutamyl phosphate reductase [Streptococcus pyogenes]VGW11397.1 gamma-glutamyl phosphate reductase [Streptococcus pyogenes]
MGMDISENKLLESPLMTNEREKEEAKVALEELLHQIQVIHLELKIVQNWDYFVFLEMVCLSAGSNVEK